jgi:hypothetical protein
MNETIIKMRISDLERCKRNASTERVNEINTEIKKWEWIVMDIRRTEDRGWRSREKI